MTLTQLGSKVDAASSPDAAVLECIGRGVIGNGVCRFTCDEFTSLCPVTGQPDFATIIIDYIPFNRLIESKSLKLFMQSFRNYPCFHEACIELIWLRVNMAAAPTWHRITGLFAPRGGIPIDVVIQDGDPPKGYHILPISLRR